MSDVLDQLGLTLDIEDGEMISDAVLRAMAKRIEQMAENLRYADAGVLVYRYVAGRAEAEDIDSSGYHDAKDE